MKESRKKIEEMRVVRVFFSLFFFVPFPLFSSSGACRQIELIIPREKMGIKRKKKEKRKKDNE